METTDGGKAFNCTGRYFQLWNESVNQTIKYLWNQAAEEDVMKQKQNLQHEVQELHSHIQVDNDERGLIKIL